jgi:hypothetical protein
VHSQGGRRGWRCISMRGSTWNRAVDGRWALPFPPGFSNNPVEGLHAISSLQRKKLKNKLVLTDSRIVYTVITL